MSSVITIIIVPIFVGVVASFIAWYLPSERFRPTDNIVSYNQSIVDIDDDIHTDSDGDSKKKQILKRNIHITNNSSKFAAYNIFCFFEFIDADSNIVYHEEKQQAYMAAHTTEEHPLIIPFKGLDTSTIKRLDPIKIKLFLIYENRYGTKKVSGPWWVRDYNLEKNTFIPKLEQ